MRKDKEDVESRYASQSKELTHLQATLVNANDNNKKRAKEGKDPQLLRNIKELEGEVQLLSLREQDFREAPKKKDQLLEQFASQKRTLTFDQQTQTTDDLKFFSPEMTAIRVEEVTSSPAKPPVVQVSKSVTTTGGTNKLASFRQSFDTRIANATQNVSLTNQIEASGDKFSNREPDQLIEEDRARQVAVAPKRRNIADSVNAVLYSVSNTMAQTQNLQRNRLLSRDSNQEPAGVVNGRSNLERSLSNNSVRGTSGGRIRSAVANILSTN